MSDGSIVSAPEPSRRIVVVKMTRRSFAWEIWDLKEAKPIHISFQRCPTFVEAWAAGCEVLMRRWPGADVAPD
jgi:hypothetical protein